MFHGIWVSMIDWFNSPSAYAFPSLEFDPLYMCCPWCRQSLEPLADTILHTLQLIAVQLLQPIEDFFAMSIWLPVERKWKKKYEPNDLISIFFKCHLMNNSNLGNKTSLNWEKKMHGISHSPANNDQLVTQPSGMSPEQNDIAYELRWSNQVILFAFVGVLPFDHPSDFCELHTFVPYQTCTHKYR